MITKQLEKLKDIFELKIPLFNGNGHINIRGREQAVKGIEDDIPNYFLLDYQDESEQYEVSLNEGTLARMIEVDLQVLIKTTGKDLCSVQAAFLSNIFAICNASNVSVTQSIKTISEIYGYEDECDLDLTLIRFSTTIAVALLPNCSEITCKDKSC